MSAVAAGILFIAITAYAILGGADFGAGFWDLIAGGSDRGRRPREVIDQSLGPVWEANHVWLIFALVVLWTGFPEAFASIMLTLFVPFTLAALGVVLRGSSFAFRHGGASLNERRALGAVFATSSVLVPFCLGAAAGAIASGRVPVGGVAGDPWASWINPTAILGGVLAVCTVAYLAAVYLLYDARRLSDDTMVEYFRRRAVVAAIVAGTVAFAGIFVLRTDAPYLFDGLTSRALPLVVISAIAGITTLALLIRHARRGARVGAVVAVGAIVVGWGVAQWDYVLPETLTVAEGAAPSGTIVALVVVTIAAAVLVFPAIGLLFVLDRRGDLPDDTYADSPPPSDTPA